MTNRKNSAIISCKTHLGGERIMASTSGNSASRGRKSTGKGTSKNTKRTSAGTRSRKKSSASARKNVDIAVKNEVMLIVIFAVAIFMFLCVTGLIGGAMCTGIRNVMFGIFGLLAYLIPILIFLGFAFGISNQGNTVAIVKMVSAAILLFLLGILAYLFMKQENLLTGGSIISELYQTSAEHHAGGGVLFGFIAHGMYTLIGIGGTIFVVIVLGIISVVFITEKSFLSSLKKGSSYIWESAREDAARMREGLREEYEDYDAYEEEPKYAEKIRPKREKKGKEEPEMIPQERVRRMDKRARGVVSSSSVTLKAGKSEEPTTWQDIHEIVILEDGAETADVYEDIKVRPYNETTYQEEDYRERVHNETTYQEAINQEISCDEAVYQQTPYDVASCNETPESETCYNEVSESDMVYDDEADLGTIDYFTDNPGVSVQSSFLDAFESHTNIQNGMVHDGNLLELYDGEIENVMPEPMTENIVLSQSVSPTILEVADTCEIRQERTISIEEEPIKQYLFPPINLLKKGDNKKGDSANQLKETALHLQQTLQTFGVRVTITDISQGPSVTRYEMQPEQGVKVSKIVGLTDDIKLNLAATDIRIEAPIPGKAAVGIEVPNKETSAVAFRDLLESETFQDFSSNLAFAVGKDIAGQVVVTDIAKMPHVLIAGATGSGKSVCINTIIMSILYKANPSDVKLIMIDPKVVELSVYNGIPHLMIPVVTDPKKASAALNWGVTEMNDRYKKFADLNVRDLKGFNKAAEMGKTTPDGEPLQKLPQIVIIVDELADLMMVASGEVEESICRLAQLARACGIHLVIATQRPSVDVITGLIKANMPSRIAFSVSSGVDSRTILDMNGAEKLLGKGDMLFYPQGYTKPARVQGAFVSDSEVSDVVDFLKNQKLGNVSYNTDIEEKIKTMQSSSSISGGGASGGSDMDAYFAEAGKFVIEKEKASIGMLQRVFKIGCNRAARIVDQLEEAGVVGAEEGTKPRRILMSMDQFQNYLEEHM